MARPLQGGYEPFYTCGELPCVTGYWPRIVAAHGSSRGRPPQQRTGRRGLAGARRPGDPETRSAGEPRGQLLLARRSPGERRGWPCCAPASLENGVLMDEQRPRDTTGARSSDTGAMDAGEEPVSMQELLAAEEAAVREVRRGSVVEGTVVRIDPDEVLVGIGLKSDGVIPGREMWSTVSEL